MPIFDHFEWLSPYYDRVFTTDRPYRLLQLAELPISGMVLDAGGGTGRVAEHIVGMVDTIVIVDFSIGMLRQASRKNGLQTTRALTEKLPFADSSFDRVIMVDALHHVINQRETLQELWRVVRPGGKIVIEEPDVRNLIVKVLAVVEKLLLMRSRFINPVRIANMSNFENVKLKISREGYRSWIVLEKIEE